MCLQLDKKKYGFAYCSVKCAAKTASVCNIMYIADESTRVCLQPIRGVDGSDYINASFIDVSTCDIVD